MWRNVAGVAGGNGAGGSPGVAGAHHQVDPLATVEYSDVEGGFPGTGNIDADPLFADALNGDFHVRCGSPVVDAGSAGYLGANQDGDGDPRPHGSAPDMGIDELTTGAQAYLGSGLDFVLRTTINGSGSPTEFRCQ